MPSIDLERLQRLLGGDGLAALRTRLRQRLGSGRTAERIVLKGLSPVERHVLEGLLGRRARAAGSLSVSLREVDAVLADAGLAPSLREALEALDGPIVDRLALRLEEERAWRDVFEVCLEPRLAGLAASSTGKGLVKRLARSEPAAATQLLRQAVRVLERIPAEGLPRSQLAAMAVGDAHGLDEGRPLASLVMAVTRLPEDRDDRDTWARIGVVVNELAAPVLVLNLRAAPDSQVGRVLHEAVGMPVHLSLRSLLRAPPRWQAGEVFVCENASVLAVAADRLGAGCAPIVCTDGMPGGSQRVLLEQLSAQGARLLYHGDFDWPGLRIGNHVMRRFGAQPWRFGAQEYVGRAGRPLQGQPVEAIWDAELAAAMRRAGYVLEEEAVVESLVEDLARAPSQSGLLSSKA